MNENKNTMDKTLKNTLLGNNFQFYMYNQAINDKQKIDDLLKRIEPLKEVSTIKEAKELMKKIMPTKQEFTMFYVGDAKCTVLNRSDVLRVCVSTMEDFICYDFS